MTETDRPLSIVAIGAHMDDTWLGMGGVALKAVRKGHRVTMVQVVSTYGAWPVVAGRQAEIEPILAKLAADAGVEFLTMGFDYMRLVNEPELVGQLAEVLADLRPDVLFCQWEDDPNQDHVALGAASRIAARHGACFLDPVAVPLRYPAEIFQYAADLQGRTFVPDTYVDVTDVLYDLLELCAIFDDLYAGGTDRAPDRLTVIDHSCGDRRVGLRFQPAEKFATALVDGRRCGAHFAEGFRAYKPRAVGTQLLAQL